MYRGREAWLILHVDHHDAAYRWAERVKVRRHSTTGGLQIVHTEEVYKEEVFQNSPLQSEDEPLFPDPNEEYLLSLGLPEEALPAIGELRTEDELEALCTRLPEDVADRLLSLYVGVDVRPPEPVSPDEPPWETPAARSQFFVVEEDAELERLLSAPWAEWTVFLHPLQRQAAYADYRGPVKITGSAGTGKSVVALHRARHLARAGKRVLLTTFTRTLAADLQAKRDLLCDASESAMISVGTVHSTAQRVLGEGGLEVSRVQAQTTKRLLEEARRERGVRFSLQFLQTEWERVIISQGIDRWEQYRDAPRAGRGVSLRVNERKKLWEVFVRVRRRLEKQGQMTFPDSCRAARQKIEAGLVGSPYDAVVVDEVQDLNPQEILFLKALGGLGENGLTLIGDGGQRIYPGGFSLRALGIEVRGRSHRLGVNYRTSRQVQHFADRLLDDEADDLDEGFESRRTIRNLFSGPEPEVRGFKNASEENAWVARRIAGLIEEGYEPGRIGVFARRNNRIKEIEVALKRMEIKSTRLDNDEYLLDEQRVKLGTMHRAKGLEFRAVFLVSINADVLPESHAVGDPDDELERRAALQRERQLLYVNFTRAREQLYVCYHGSPSIFLSETGMLTENEEVSA